MDILDFRDYCLGLPFTEETTPFDEVTLVYKVQGKMFALCDMDDFRWVSLKCDPERAVELRERYPEWIRPAYHFNKVHWNMVDTRGDLPAGMIRELTFESYLRVVEGLKKALREDTQRAVANMRG